MYPSPHLKLHITEQEYIRKKVLFISQNFVLATNKIRSTADAGGDQIQPLSCFSRANAEIKEADA